jgi:hypothetical protein
MLNKLLLSVSLRGRNSNWFEKIDGVGGKAVAEYHSLRLNLEGNQIFVF